MGEQAVALAKAVNYDSAGTVEFVAGQDRSFYFLEMNTRLQVEHPVTELITGVDLVEQMIRVAAGEVLSIRQDDVKLDGWAVESRIYAEDPTRNFLPSTGRLVKYRAPAEQTADGVTVRNDTGVYEGGEISIYYDPMIAKLVTHAPTRAQAIDAQTNALDQFYVDGIRHNIPFLTALMEHPRWREGRLSTGFIAEEFPDGFHSRAPDEVALKRVAALVAHVDFVFGRRRREISGQLRPTHAYTRDKERTVQLGRDFVDIVLHATEHGCRVEFADGDTHSVEGDWDPTKPVWSGVIDGQAYSALIRPIFNGWRVDHSGFSAPALVYTRREGELARLMPEKKAADTSKVLLCPMPGLVKQIMVAEGQEAKAGEPLCIVEAMKMENVLRAERDVTVKSLKCKPGDSLAVDAVIMEFA
jgi:propionyl-CoA carboxylase alpha chain